MISILSGIVLMLAIGTLVQRGDVVTEFFGSGDEPIVLVDDSLTVEPDTLTRIDVLSNDEGVKRSHEEALAVLTQPDCGRVFVQDGALQFLAERDCEVEQVVTYGLTDEEELRPGVVTVTVRGATGIRRAPEPQRSPEAVALAPAPAPAAVPQAVTPQSRGTTHRADLAPRLVDPSEGRVGSPEPGAEPSGFGGVGAAPSAPRVAAPSAPGLPGGSAPAAPALPGSDLSGAAVAGLTSPSAPVPNRAVLSEPAIGPVGGGAVGGGIAPQAPLAPSMTAPSLGAPSMSAPSLAAPAAPSAPSLAPAVPAPGIASPAAPSMPGGSGSGTALAGIEPVAPAVPGGLAPIPQPGRPAETVAAVDGSSGNLDVAARGTAGAPQGIEQPVPTIALARVETPVPSAAPARREIGLSLDLSGPSAVAPMGPQIGSTIDGSGGAAIALAEPTQGLGDIMSLQGGGIALALIDTTAPAPLAAPDDEAPVEHGTAVAAIDPAATAVPDVRRGAQDPQPAVGAAPQLELAALPNAELACVVPPSITLDIRAAGETLLMINSPCHADSVAELTYQKLRFGVRIDRTGRGEIMMLGFESSAEAVLDFADDEKLEFTVPFTGIDRVERVALSWDAPVALELHAFEFNAERGTEGHVYRGAPRSFEEVRRRGGGFLSSFEPVEGVGQHVQVYSHWIRRGGNWGVVRMYLDFASRHRDRLEGTCGSGELSRPSFTITRSARGRFEGADTRRIAAIGCDHVEKLADQMIDDAVRDIIISQR